MKGRLVLQVLVLSCSSYGVAPAQVYDGLVLANPLYNRTVRLIDTTGQTVKTWTCNANVAYTPYLMPDSTMWRPCEYQYARMRGGAYGGLIEQYDWNGNVIRSFVWSDSNHQQHHDIHPMPNGHILLVSWERKTAAEARARGRRNINSDMWPDEIIEYDPVGDSVVWEWHAWDHLIQDVDSTLPNYGVISEHPELIDINLAGIFMGGDWMHVNCVDYNQERDEVIFCSHFLSELYVIDHSTTTEEARGHTGGRCGKGGDILYRWGNPMNYGRGDSSDQRFFVVHGANWIRPGLRGAGNILVFNNGDRPGTAQDYSSVEEITPPLDSLGNYYIAPDSAFGPSEPTWIYANPGQFYSAHTSGAYRMPNDNTIICEGWTGRLFEVTYDKRIVWQYNLGSWTGRVLKYPREFATCIKEHAPLLEATRSSTTPLSASPNPFVDHLVISYAPPRPTLLKIVLVDASGRVISTIVDGHAQEERRTFRFQVPRSLSPGVYFVRLQTGQGEPGVTRVVKSL